MRLGHKILLGGAGGVLLLLIAVFFAAPSYLNAPERKAAIEASLSEAISGTAKYQRLDVSLFPSPHVVMHRATLLIPSQAAGTLAAVNIYPNFTSLLKGTFRISKIRVLSPNLALTLPETASAQTPEPDVKAMYTVFVSALKALGSDLIMQVDNGKLTLSRKEKTLLSLSRMNARSSISSDDMDITFTAVSDPWGPVSLSGTFSLDLLKAEVSHLSAGIGRSSLSNLSTRLTMTGLPHLEVLSGQAILVLQELYPLISSSSSAADRLKDVKKLRGILKLTSMNVEGPLLKPVAWRATINGVMENIVVELDARLLPAPLSINGFFSLQNNALEARDLSASIGKSFLTQVALRLDWTKTPRIDVISGSAAISLDELYEWRAAAPALSTALHDVQSLQGILRLSSINVSGLPGQRPKWRIRIAGETKDNIVVASAYTPAPVSLQGRFVLTSDRIEVQALSASLEHSSLSGFSGGLTWKDPASFEVISGMAIVSLDDVYQWRSTYAGLAKTLDRVSDLSGIITLSSMNLRGPLRGDGPLHISASGSGENVVLNASFLPGPLGMKHGMFSMTPDKLSLSNVQATVLDSALTLNGSFLGLPKRIDAVDLSADGTVGPESVAWLFSTYGLPDGLLVNAPLIFSPVRVVWQNSANLSLSGNVIVFNGPALAFDVSRSSGEIEVRRALIQDNDSSATLSFKHGELASALSFSGLLAQTTVHKLFAHQAAGLGKIQGDLRLDVRRETQPQYEAQGSLEVNDLVIPWGVREPIAVSGISLLGQKNILSMKSASGTWAGSRFDIKGDVVASSDAFTLDLDLSSGAITVADIIRALGAENQEPEGSKPAEQQPDSRKPEQHKPGIRGSVRSSSSSIAFGRFTFSPVVGVTTIEPESVSSSITEANVCGVPIQGTLAFYREGISLDFKLAAVQRELRPAISCLTQMKTDVTGTFDLKADIRASGTGTALLSSMEGKVNFTSKEGRIHQYPALAKIFSVLSVMDIFRGKLPDLGGDGFPYHTMVVKGAMHQGKFVIDEAYIGGSSIDIIAVGEIDLVSRKTDMVVLVAPFSTVNWFIRHIPLIGKIMGNTLISIPVRVSGNTSDPDVTFLSPTAVGSRVLELLKNIVELPVELISPFQSKETDSGK